MKLSQMNTDKALEVICVISPFIESLLVNPKIKEVLENLENLQMIDILKVIPIILRDHKNETLEVLACVNEKTVEEVKNQPATETIKEIKELLTDEEFMNIVGL